MNIETIVVQAGGRGSRMKQLTANKPKALVPVENLPILFHLFRKYPDRHYIIIGDYKEDVLRRYLKAFAKVSYEVVSSEGEKGTCAGLQKALSLIPEDTPFLLIWCDLILSDSYQLPTEDGNYIGISKDFPCRWMYKNGVFKEEKSVEHGVAGHFVFRNKSMLRCVPKNGELVRWMSEQGLTFNEQPLFKTHEYGLYSEWAKTPTQRCRPFNRIEVEGDTVIKYPIDEQGRQLASREIAWYRKMQGKRLPNLPHIDGFEPLRMEYIDGKTIYECNSISKSQKHYILEQLIDCLKKIHNLESVPADRNSYYEAYIGKTFKRLEKVRDLVPFANNPVVTINGTKCRNVFFYRDEVEARVMEYLPKKFKLIHGDCTFSNIMLRKDGSAVLIDPRGYFGTTGFYGDAAYDWVKLYYSLYSNYDTFNLNRFVLNIGKDSVMLKIDSNHWEDMEDDFFQLLDNEVTYCQMKLLLAITWLSLTTYTWQNYDSICGAFYNGLYYMEKALEGAKI